ncbi:MAG: OmpA family protein [Chitinispirillales bacterium]|nr:OmpA family protein [Chitinispirillales bacterium]
MKKIFVSVFLCAVLFTAQSFAFSNNDDADDDALWIGYVPSISYWGLRGLSQTVSAEPLGAGRFNLALFHSYFKQKQEGLISPIAGTNVVTGRGVFSWGFNDDIDFFGIAPYYVVANNDIGTRFSLSGLTVGIQYSVGSIPRDVPFRLAFQGNINFGMKTGTFSEDDITTNSDYWRENFDPNWRDHENHWEKNWSYAGYDFFDARKRNQTDYALKLVGTFLLGEYVNLHLNEGIVITPGTNEYLFISALGLEVNPINVLTIGLEVNWRTLLAGMAFSDPLWLTPTVAYRSPYHVNGLVGLGLTGGLDICISSTKNRSDGTTATKPLEKYRGFLDILLSFDRFASRRADIERERRLNEAEKARLRREAALTSAQRDSIAAKAHEDSLRLVDEMRRRAEADSIRSKFVADSLAAEMGDLTERARQDSIAQAQAAALREAELLAEAESQRIADSIALADAQRRLDEERAKRSEAEQNLLSTGMLVLDAVYFETGRADIHRNSRPYLTTIAKMLVKYPKLRIEIGGHTDNTGSHETNTRLSQQRAEAVFMFMHNVEPELAQMLTAKGYGPAVPKADNATAAGREANRRVELRVLNPEVLQEYNP